MAYTILIVEDDPDIIDMLALYMDTGEFNIRRAGDGEVALDILKETPVDVALVDIMMPRMNGYEFIRAVRKTYNFPLIVLSAKGEERDRVLGLNIGADAYIAKPFNPFEVIAQVRAVLRRFYELGGAVDDHQSGTLTVGDLTLNMATFTLKKNGVVVPLTTSELKIMAKLMQNPNRVYTRAQLYACLNEGYQSCDDNTVMVHISNIRAKIEDDPSDPIYIKTVRGLGYKIECR